LIAGIIVIGILSLLASAFLTHRAPYFAFYMMPIRIFEFAIGALVLILVIRLPPVLSFMCGVAGAGMLTVTIFMFDAKTPWPATNALVPCMGTVLLLIAGRNGLWCTILSAYPLRAIGRISYSVYLVHWPLIVLYRDWVVVPPTPRDLVVLFFASIALGAALYVLVERFYRVSPESKVAWLFVGSDTMRSIGAMLEAAAVRRQSHIFGLFLILPAVTVCFSAIVIARNGLPERMAKGRVQQAASELNFAGDLCSSMRNRCAFGDVASQKIVYLVGDSHALNLVYGLDRLFKEAGIRGIALYDHGCLFLHGTQRFLRGVPDPACARNVAAAFNQLARDRFPVIFAGSYRAYVRQIGPAGASAPFEGSGRDYIDWIEQYLRDSLRAIGANDRTTIIISSAYNTGINTAKCVARFGDADPKCSPEPLEIAQKKAGPVDSMLLNLRLSFPGLTILDPKTSFCNTTRCIVSDRGGPFFRDTTHLTSEGSAFLVDQLKPALLSALTARGL
jgi:hypothetical protein